MGTLPSTFNNPRAIHYCKAPSGLYVGWIVKDNGHYWGSGRTYSDMEAHVKNTLYQARKCPTSGYFLDSSPVDQSDVPVELMAKAFKTRAWLGGSEKAKKITEEAVNKAIKEQAEQPISYDYYETAMDGRTLVVYGLVRKEVARYKMSPNTLLPQLPSMWGSGVKKVEGNDEQ